MNEEQFHAGVMSAIEAWRTSNFPEMDAVYENGPAPTPDEVSSPWLDVSIRPYSGGSASLGAPASGRERGVVAIQIYTRGGEGTAASNKVRASLRQALAGLRAAGWWLDYPTPYMPTAFLGWHKTGLMFPYTLNT